MNPELSMRSDILNQIEEKVMNRPALLGSGNNILNKTVLKSQLVNRNS